MGILLAALRIALVGGEPATRPVAFNPLVPEKGITAFRENGETTAEVGSAIVGCRNNT